MGDVCAELRLVDISEAGLCCLPHEAVLRVRKDAGGAGRSRLAWIYGTIPYVFRDKYIYIYIYIYVSLNFKFIDT